VRPEELEVTDHRTGCEPLADPHGSGDRLVGRAPGPVTDDDHPATREPTGVGHPTRQGRPDRLPHVPGEIDATVAGRWNRATTRGRGLSGHTP
jgi:hypothetical protein